MALGIVLVSGSLAIHRGFWFCWRFFLAIHEPEIAGHFINAADWLVFAVAGIITGYMIHVEPDARRMVRKFIGPATRWLLMRTRINHLIDRLFPTAPNVEMVIYWPMMVGTVVVLYIAGAIAGILA